MKIETGFLVNLPIKAATYDTYLKLTFKLLKEAGEFEQYRVYVR